MNSREQIRDYLTAIDASRVVENRVLEVFDFYEAIFPDSEIQKVFISETVGNEGQRTYENLWFFYESYWCEAHEFVLEDKFDITRRAAVDYILYRRESFEPDRSTPRSRLKVDYKFGDQAGGLKASGANCEFLHSIFIDRLLPLTSRE